MTRRFVVGGLVVTLAAAGGAATLATPSTEPEPSAASIGAASRSVPVDVLEAERSESFLRRRVYTGTLVARRRSVLSFEIAGKLKRLGVDEGEHVTAGQELGELDTRRLTAQRAVAAAELQGAQATLDEFLAGPRKEDIAAAAAEVRSQAAQRDIAERRMKRRESLVPTSAISREEYEAAFYEFRAASARTDVAQKTLDELEAGTRSEQILAQRARVAALEARLADIDHQLQDAVLTAPFAGRVARRRLDEGAVVRPGEPVLELIEEDQLEAWIGVPAKAAERLTVGDSLAIEVHGVEHEAVIQSVRPELDVETRTQNVVLKVLQNEGLVAGQVVRVAVPEEVAIAGYWAPTVSLTPGRRGLWSVLVVGPEGLAAERPIEVIENAGDQSYVRGAIEPGDRLIVSGAHRVVAGQRVSVTD